MTNKKNTQEIFDKIEERHISPKPKWQFLLKNYLVWFFGLVSLLVGGVATSVIIFTVVNSDLEAYRYLRSGVSMYITTIVPYAWMLFFGIFIFIADYNIKHTKTGYKYSLKPIIIGSIGVSAILGTIFYSVGLSHRVDHALGQSLSGYSDLTEKRLELWTQPEKGLLAGTVVSVEESDFVIEDINGKTWNIEGDKLTQMDNIILSKASDVNIVGTKLNDTTFEACAVRPWRTKGESKALHGKMLGDKPFRAMGLNPRELNDIKEQFRKQNFDERNIFKLRNSLCERHSTVSKTNIDNITN